MKISPLEYHERTPSCLQTRPPTSRRQTFVLAVTQLQAADQIRQARAPLCLFASASAQGGVQPATHCNVSPASWGPARKSASMPIPAAQTNCPSHHSKGKRSRSPWRNGRLLQQILECCDAGRQGVRRIRSRPALSQQFDASGIQQGAFQTGAYNRREHHRMPTACQIQGRLAPPAQPGPVRNAHARGTR